MLDSYVHAGVLYSAFEVAGQLLVTRDELRGDTLYHEIVSGPLGATLVTSDTVLATGDSMPPVQSLRLSGAQVARLARE